MGDFILTIRISRQQGILAAVVVAVAALVALVPSAYVITPLAMILLLSLLWKRTVWGIALATLLYPFSQNYLWLGSSTNIPYADVVMLFILIVWLAKTLYFSVLDKHWHLSRQSLYNILPFLALLLAGALSLLNVWPEQMAESIRYWWRFVGFTYLAYFFVTQEVIKKARDFWHVSYFIFGLGVFLSVMGVASVFWPEISRSFPMATPLSWFGLFPFAASHNLLAEALVSIIPFSALVVYKVQDDSLKKYLWLGVFLMFAVALLTFSRTGWIVLLVEILLFTGLYYNYNLKKILQKYWLWLLLLVVLAGLYFFTWGQSYFVTSSNDARLAMIEASLDLFRLEPLVGHGVGTWLSLTSGNIYYTFQFGLPYEQHGVIWKLIAEQGIIGLLVWLGIMFYLVYRAVKVWLNLEKNNPWRLTALVALIVISGQIIFQMLDTGYYSPKMWLPIGLSFALLNISARYRGLMKSETK
ncbi:MAG: O-antigen ligase family protein [Candidatus Komeilibacteria bacterium]|nr:O-antigen ligase family protein [Candidatus Komeilibacteria bacterium]